MISCDARKQNKAIRNKKAEDSTALSEVEHKRQTPVAVLTMHVITNLLHIPMIYESQ